ncbi:MAG: transposase [Candidatus Riflebacteria bacterium]|nr:transposase [Candidatus Riflebacteria bacterium]
MKESHHPPSDLALWRYGIISQLLHRDPAGRTMQEVLDNLAQSEYRFPDGQLRRLSSETLRKWLARYRIGGLASLSDQERCDKGRSLVPQSIIERIRALRDEHPRWTLAVLFRQLMQEKLWNGLSPSSAALYRFCRIAGLERKSAPTDFRSFAFGDFGNLWIADFLHGPKLFINKQKRKTYVHMILDDATRFVVSAGVFLHEDVEVLIAELKQAVRRHGIPQRFYTDNGAAYRSRHLRIVGARLQIQMPHTPPYTPQGRGNEKPRIMKSCI